MPRKTVLMIRPSNFGYNVETAVSNSFQQIPIDSNEVLQDSALKEFDTFVEQLKELDVEVIVYEDFEQSKTPDSIFPNNWFSTHEDGLLILYPMATSNRRKERRSDIVISLKDRFRYRIEDFTYYEDLPQPHYLEGTGSLIFDHESKVVYAALSIRTSRYLVEEVSDLLGYKAVCFNALGKQGELIYHTNVMMSIGDKYIAIGLDTVLPEDLPHLNEALANSGKSIIELSNNQVYEQFTGNMLQLANKKGQRVLVLSKKAYEGLNASQLESLQKLNDHLLPISIPTIEKIGGGSVRCMLAEIYSA